MRAKTSASQARASTSVTSGTLSYWRTTMRLSALWPLISRSISNTGVEPADRFQRQRRDHCRLLSLSVGTRVLVEISHDEDWAPGVDPTGRFEDRARPAARLVEVAIAAAGIGLEDSGVAGQVCLGMLTGPIARVIEHGPGETFPTQVRAARDLISAGA